MISSCSSHICQRNEVFEEIGDTFPNPQVTANILDGAVIVQMLSTINSQTLEHSIHTIHKVENADIIDILSVVYNQGSDQRKEKL